ncbi:hypothetical protein MPER_07368 [Moniliophthora perniciosa FA553]|nr:hypothetical protein MPER_07368 [Moniliophthora perniciosa FA553]
MQFKAYLFLPSVLVGPVLSICPGFNYGIGNVEPLGGGVDRWRVFNDDCTVADSLTTNLNPCTEGTPLLDLSMLVDPTPILVLATVS